MPHAMMIDGVPAVVMTGRVIKIGEPCANSKTDANVMAFVLFNGNDYFGASIWLHQSQADAFQINDGIQVINGNVIERQDDQDKDKYWKSVAPLKGQRYLTVNRVAVPEVAGQTQTGTPPPVGDAS